MRKSDGTATGLTGSTTFTPTTADGTVDVSFTIPTGYAGQSLVAFETLYTGATAAGEPVTEHTDINDVDQTVAVMERAVVPGGPGPSDGGDGLATTGGALPIGLTPDVPAAAVPRERRRTTRHRLIRRTSASPDRIPYLRAHHSRTTAG